MESLNAQENEAKLVALARSSYRSDLTEAELRVIHDSVREGPATVRKGDVAANRHIRGDFFRWLLNDPRVTPLVDKDGLQVTSATIDGPIDLDSSRVLYSLYFEQCVFTGVVSFRWATMRNVVASNCVAQGAWDFGNAVITGDLRLSPNFQSAQQLSLFGAHVEGDVDLSSGRFTSKSEDATISLIKTEVKGGVFLNDLNCAGDVQVLDAKFGNEVIATGAVFGGELMMGSCSFAASLYLMEVQVKEGLSLDKSQVGATVYASAMNLQGLPVSLNLDSAVIGGDLYLEKNPESPGDMFRAAGSVFASELVVKQRLVVSDAELPKLNLTGAQLGSLEWRSIRHPEKTTLILTRATAKSFLDEQDSWPAKGNLMVDGFVYDQMNLEVPRKLPDSATKTDGGGSDPTDRINWLKRQSETSQLLPQPWLQLAAFVKAQGNPTAAKHVIYEMKRIQARRYGVSRRTVSMVYDVIEENPLRLFLPVCLLWAFGWIIFWRARRMAAMSPTDKDAFAHFEEKGVEPPHYPPFSAAVYTLENVLPVVKLGQDAMWQPNPRLQPEMRKHPKRWVPRMTYGWLSVLRWVLIVVGWVLALILAAAIGDTFKA